MPKTREERIFFLVGNTLNIIAATMDEEDTQTIYDSLHNLDTDTTHLIAENNKQVKTNSELQE